MEKKRFLLPAATYIQSNPDARDSLETCFLGPGQWGCISLSARIGNHQWFQRAQEKATLQKLQGIPACPSSPQPFRLPCSAPFLSLLSDPHTHTPPSTRPRTMGEVAGVILAVAAAVAAFSPEILHDRRGTSPHHRHLGRPAGPEQHRAPATLPRP